MHTEVEQSPVADSPGPADVREQTDRILASPLFRDSPIQQRLLRFLIDETLSGRAAALKEFTIGQSVFQRRPDFDPQTDSIVRVQMGVLRKKLAAYYQGPGTGDVTVIEIPRGHYSPATSFRRLTAPELMPEPQRVSPPEARKPANRWMYAASGLLAGVLLAYAAFHWTANPTRPASSEWRTHPLWRGFLDPGSNTKLIVGTPFMVGLDGEGLLVRDTTVNDPKDLGHSKWIGNFESLTKRKAVPTELYTGLGEAAGISLLSRFYASTGQDLPLIRNRLAKWQDFSAGNIIILSSLRFLTLKQELARPSQFEFSSISGARSAVRNLNPAPGEASIYESTVGIASPNGGTDYALVTAWPGTMAGRRIMSIGGSHTWGTEGAVAYITDPASLRELRGKLEDRTLHGEPSDSLQILVKVEVRDNQVVSASYLTHRWLR